MKGRNIFSVLPLGSPPQLSETSIETRSFTAYACRVTFVCGWVNFNAF